MKFDKLAPTGKLVRGNVFDVAQGPLERALRDYDSQLYVTWNPRKNRGWGLWEVRRRPEKQSIVNQYEWEGVTYTQLGYKELDIVNHVIEAPYLSYQMVERIKAADTWNNKNWVKDLEYEEAHHRVRQEDKSRAEAVYNMKQHRSILKAWKEEILSGRNHAEIARFWK